MAAYQLYHNTNQSPKHPPARYQHLVTCARPN
jgi:hypothetical protein